MLNRQIEQVWNVKSVAPAGLTLDQLKPYQLAVLDERTQQTVAAPSDCKGKPFRLVWKSPSKGNGGAFPDKNNVRKPIQSFPITDVDRITKFEAANTERKPFEAYLGYNGISACQSLSFKCGQTYQLVIEAQGKPIRDTLGRDYTEIIPFTTNCCENCDVEDNVVKALHNVVKEVENHAHYLKNFFDVYPIYDCCPPVTPFTETAFADYCLTICDAGDNSALGDVQVAYQSNDIYRESRDGGLSTYKMDCKTVGLPAAFVQTRTVLSDCETCPTGFTATGAAKKYIITDVNDGLGVNTTQWLAEVVAIGGVYAEATSAKRISYANGVSTYEILIPAAETQPSVPVAGVTYIFVGDVAVTCTQTTPTSTAWVACGTKYKIKRTMELVIKNGDCDDTDQDLADLIAYYTNVPDLVIADLDQDITGDCISRYTIDQFSNCLEDGCDWKGSDLAKFADIPAYKGVNWTPIKCEGWTFDEDGCPVAPTPADAADCRGGLKFVGKNFENDIIECADDYWEARETEGLTLQVSISEYGVSGCEKMDVDWTVVQRPNTLQGTGFSLLRREIQAREGSAYEYHGANSPDGNIMAARRGEAYSFDAEKYYHSVTLYHNYKRPRTAQQTGSDTREAITVAVEADKTALFATVKSLMNAIGEIQGVCDFV